MSYTILPIIILNARPAAGKSEIIDYLRRVPLLQRQERFHIGEIDVIDDFPMLWAWFEEDAILNRMGYPRLHTDEEGYFVSRHLWHVLIERISLEYAKRRRDRADYHSHTTAILEFSRGAEEHGGYSEAYQHLTTDILRQAATFYIQVSFEESLRKNQARRNPDRPDSILEHSLDDKKMYRLYRKDDWETFSADDPAYLHVRGIKIPYVVFENEDDVTTPRGTALGERLEKTLGRLWRLKQAGG